jgi:hypothetical protein
LRVALPTFQQFNRRLLWVGVASLSGFADALEPKLCERQRALGQIGTDLGFTARHRAAPLCNRRHFIWLPSELKKGSAARKSSDYFLTLRARW